MAERMTGRPWSAHEDILLSRAVAEFDGEADWKTIAQRVPGRTNKACRKRWLHSLSPSIKKSAWTKDEDENLMSLYKLYGAKWSVIARQIPGRTDDACSKRYREALDPALKKDEWTQDEDAKLLGLYAQMGGRWVQVGQQLQRSSLGCRNRWRLLERKRSPAIREVTPTESPIPQSPPNSFRVTSGRRIASLMAYVRPISILAHSGFSGFPTRIDSIARRANTSSAVLSPPSHKCLFTPSRRQRLPCHPLYDHPLSIFCLIRPRLCNSRAARNRLCWVPRSSYASRHTRVATEHCFRSRRTI
ncbi:hypothetical protein EDB92DRAFT_1432129 [Lactarius akahatsu]|uniref:Uncharacterized protein n=1 Tax=Lactarius akahatsu TaxID=416441 RepID=A0AAD4LSF0_9AGAM|nr:hypothetical protein EDB92DRAFT_1432129 [Lactarius akahatsu]